MLKHQASCEHVLQDILEILQYIVDHSNCTRTNHLTTTPNALEKYSTSFSVLILLNSLALC